MGFFKYLKDSFFDYIYSFKADGKFHFVILADVLYYAIFYLMIIRFIIPVFFIQRFGEFYTKLLQYAQVPAEFSGSVQSSMSAEGFYLIMLVVGILLFMILSFAFFKGLIWKLIIEKDFRKKTLKEFLWRNLPRYLLMMLGLSLLFIMTFYISFSFIKTDMFTIFLIVILFPLFFHVLTIFQPVLILNTGFWDSFRKTFGVAFKKIYLFILPYIMISLTLILVIIVINGLSYIFSRLSGVIMFLFLVLYFNWMKYYLIRIIRPLAR